MERTPPDGGLSLDGADRAPVGRIALGAVSRKRVRISTPTAGLVARRLSASTLASFQVRAPAAVTASPQRAARTPRTLLAAIEMPVPVQQQTIPTSARPAATASPTARPIEAHSPQSSRCAPGRSAPKRSTSIPRSASAPSKLSVSGPRSSEPIAQRIRSGYC